MGKYSEAIKDFDYVLESGDLTHAYINRGVAYKEKGGISGSYSGFFKGVRAAARVGRTI